MLEIRERKKIFEGDETSVFKNPFRGAAQKYQEIQNELKLM